jgi:hypothetical protein
VESLSDPYPERSEAERGICRSATASAPRAFEVSAAELDVAFQTLSAPRAFEVSAAELDVPFETASAPRAFGVFP